MTAMLSDNQLREVAQLGLQTSDALALAEIGIGYPHIVRIAEFALENLAETRRRTRGELQEHEFAQQYRQFMERVFSIAHNGFAASPRHPA